MSSNADAPKGENKTPNENKIQESLIIENNVKDAKKHRPTSNQARYKTVVSKAVSGTVEQSEKQKKVEKNKKRKEKKVAPKLKAQEPTGKPTGTNPFVHANGNHISKSKSKNQKRKDQKPTQKPEQQQPDPSGSLTLEKKNSSKTDPNADHETEKKLLKAEKRKKQKAAKKLRSESASQSNSANDVKDEVGNPTESATGDSKSVNDIDDSGLVLNVPLSLNLHTTDALEFFCDCCPVELVGYEAASNHVNEFNHQKMSVVYNSLSDSIKCQSCGETDLSLLHSILLTSSSLSLCCSDCLENNGYDPLINAFSTQETLLKYVDNMYHLNDLSCINCRSTDTLAVDEELNCYCAECVEKDKNLKDKKLINRSDINFLSTVFDDSRYIDFESRIRASGQDIFGFDPDTTTKSANTSPSFSFPSPPPPSSTTSHIPSSNLELKQEKEAGKKKKHDNKKKDKNSETTDIKSHKDKENNPPVKPLSGSKTASDGKVESKNSKKLKKGKAITTNGLIKQQESLKSMRGNGSFPSDKPNGSKNAGPSKNFGKSPESTSSQHSNILDATDLKIEDKFERLKQIVKATLPKDIRLQFDDLNEYYSYLSYSLFLEELYAQDVCTDVNFEWKGESECIMTGPTKKWFDMYVNDDVHHLKKHPFTRDQPIFIIRKSEASLRWDSPPEFWLAHVSSSSLAKIGKRGKSAKVKKHAVLKKTNQVSTFTLKLYHWNDRKFPVRERGDQFAFLPGSNVVGRILNSMNKIENESFKKLILGKEKIKRINFHNKIGKYFNVLNDSQKNALQSALNNTVTILQGPPGSGKTSTIYEIILQLLTQLHYYPILVVAASNLAVDNIAEKLMGEHKDIILRITSLSKEKEYPETHSLGSICLHNKISQVLPPNLKDIENRLKRNASQVSSSEFSKYLDACQQYGSQIVKQANIIFATTAGIAGPYLKKVKRMPVIIMDEATQSSEPSTLIPLGAQGCNKVILVGDTAQLSVFTRVKSLEMSLFQRVLENGTYEDPFMLDTQYRMHPDISHFSRRKFYGNKLKDGITAENRRMEGIKYPVYFFDHQGVGASETKMFSASGEEFGFSWVNKKEVNYIERILEKLIVDHHVPPSTIGVMTGYAAQRELIVKALENNKVINPNENKTRKYVDKEDLSEKKNVTVCNVNGIIVATIDAYQGREMNFVLLSCVRSNEGGNIGFMSDKRRMNVALTRAKYSFIICGDAKCMSSNGLWKEYIEELQDKGFVKQSINDY
ncbi:hypothetical protein PMKS-000215 [Pichia membranifaciens]|uniref:AAA+ ATPase domain-containing protein n=1 Tax=Pichia membranifaciens TaxID=4926 RepID=A0A1Q2YB50_9ASCO|nr:hypothetical protein PMKS-000215 [Pichia membranifaciens]